MSLSLRGKLFIVVAVLCFVAPHIAVAAIGDQVGKVIPELLSYQRFGNSVAIQGNNFIVGAPGNDTLNLDAGALFVYDTQSTSLVRTIYANDGTAFDSFGGSVDLSGNIAVVGAWSDGPEIGSAYVFDISTGSQLAKLVPSDGVYGGHFGSVAIAGNRIVVGSVGNDSAYVFDTTGAFLRKLLPVGSFGGGVDFGINVDISGDIAIVGANGDEAKSNLSGAAYLFDVNTGSQLSKLVPVDATATSDFFGYDVAIQGNIAVVGVPNDDDKGLQSGSVYLFDVPTGQQIAKILAGDGAAGDQFGHAVEINGNTLIIGASGDSDKGRGSGSVYLFDVQTKNQIAKLVASDLRTEDRFGSSVALSGNVAIIGAPSQDITTNDVGAAYIFDATRPVPEPTLSGLFSVGCVVFGWIRRQRKN
jgi:hypothetical protein